MNSTRSVSARTLSAGIVILAGAVFLSGLGADPRPLSPREAVSAALSSDARVESATYDWLAAQTKAREAGLRKLPSLSLGAGYTRLSHVDSSISFSGLTFALPSLDDSFQLSASLQYPLFTGFRVEESAKLAEVQAQGKGIAAEMIRRSIIFEAQRVYWETQRSTLNVGMLKESLALAAQNLEVTRQQLAHGSAMNADLLTAQMRYDQAAMDLGAGTAAQKQAFWTLASLVEGSRGTDLTQWAAADPETTFALTAKPEPVPDSRFPTLIEAELIGRALANRPETRAASLISASAEIGRKIAEAPLYPTVSITGGYLFADPNPRVPFQTDPWTFTGTWSLGLALSYDLGGLPANLAARDAQGQAVEKNRADERHQKEAVVLDVRASLLAFQQTRRDYVLVSGMIDQARENERVTEEKVAAGTASELDFLGARTARLKVEFAITNKLIDQQVAAADLERAAALAPLD
ncbi:MAG: TolC family protein [Spirochaetia bacterium]|jgi:outer membrane protein TolC